MKQPQLHTRLSSLMIVSILPSPRKKQRLKHLSDLGGQPTQYREVQNHESPRFKSYFHHLMILHGGVPTGFHLVSTVLPEDTKKMYTMSTTRNKLFTSRSKDGKQLIVREIPLEGLVLRQGVVYVLDKGPLMWQFNTKKS